MRPSTFLLFLTSVASSAIWQSSASAIPTVPISEISVFPDGLPLEAIGLKTSGERNQSLSEGGRDLKDRSVGPGIDFARVAFGIAAYLASSAPATSIGDHNLARGATFNGFANGRSNTASLRVTSSILARQPGSPTRPLGSRPDFANRHIRASVADGMRQLGQAFSAAGADSRLAIQTEGGRFGLGFRFRALNPNQALFARTVMNRDIPWETLGYRLAQAAREVQLPGSVNLVIRFTREGFSPADPDLFELQFSFVSLAHRDEL